MEKRRHGRFPRWATVLILLAFAAGPPGAALDPRREPYEYPRDVWRPADGLPSGSVAALLQTSDGDLWIAGDEGLARFDGVRFTRVDRRHALDLAEATDGSLWIAGDGGLTRLKDGRLTTLTAADGLAGDRVVCLAAGRDGGVWAGTASGLTHVHDGELTTYNVRDGLPAAAVTALAVDGEGDLWIGTPRGLARLRHGRITAGDFADEAISALGTDRDGFLWVATTGGGLARFDGGFSFSEEADVLGGKDGVRITGDRDGHLWIGTYGGGLVRLRNGQASVLGTADGLASDFVWAIAEDREGSLWIGTEGGGLLRLRDALRLIHAERGRRLEWRR